MMTQTVLETLHNPPNYPAAGHALPIDKLLQWVYHVQRADAGREGADAPKLLPPDSCYRLMRRSELGVSVDGRAGRNKLHPDAEAIDALLMQHLHPNARRLVVFQALSCCPPEWMPGARPRFRAVLNARGRPLKLYEGRRNVPVACIVEAQSSAELIAYRRRVYAAWWSYVEYLRQWVEADGGLKSHVALPISVPAEPWNAVARSGMKACVDAG